MRHRAIFAGSALLGAVLAPLVVPSGASAQEADFLFRRPWVSLGIRGGYAIPRAGSDIFEFTSEQLTVEKSDFRSAAGGLEIAVRATERIDVAFGVDVSRSETRSEFRDWIGDDDLPIEQTTVFQRIPATVTVKGYLWERGREVSRFAWIPARWSPYAGVGAGVVWYRFQQDGEFVDFDTADLEIFQYTYRSEDRAPTAHVLAGADVSLGPRFVLTGEGRYSWARADMDLLEFDGFDKIDLSGLQVTAGVSVRF
jgi:opacity protein-like surface antigen